MKAKDIALLCTAAAGAGAAAGAALTSSGKARTQKKAEHIPEKRASRSTEGAVTENVKAARIIKLEAEGSPRLVCTDNDCRRAVLIFGAENDCRAYMLSESEPTSDGESGTKLTELRCPSGITGAAASESGAFFITAKGGVTVYSDEAQEPVFCGLTAPEYVCSAGGRFYVFSDCLLYICGGSGEIEKTVSLGALIDISGSDICDAESTDGSFAAARASVKKCLPLGKGSFAAIITDDRRSFLMHCEDGDFYSFEKTYEDIYDVCVFGGFAYYLCGLKDGFGIIKTRITDKKCETMAKYFLCGKENPPVGLYGGIYGIGVLYADGAVKLLLPEISSERKRESCRKKLNALGKALEDVHVQGIFTLGNVTAYISEGEIFEALI